MEFYHEKIETDAKVPVRIYYGEGGSNKLRYPLHWHHNLEFNLVLEGCICGKINGRPVEVHAGEIFFVNSGELHETDARGSKTMNAITFLLSDELLREYCPDLNLWFFSFEQGSSQQKRLAQLIQKCTEIYKKKQQFYELELSIELRRICSILLQECRQKKPGVERGNRDWRSIEQVKKAISYMKLHYKNELSLNVMADVMGMTPSYFSRFFKQATGQTFHSYLTWIRLDHAKHQLNKKEMTVTELAMDNGFPNVKSFIQAFHKEYGVTPGYYKKEQDK